MLRILGLSSKQHQLYLALKRENYHEDFTALSEITGEEMRNLEYPARGQYYSVSTASQAHLRVWSAFIHYQGTVNHIFYDVDDIPSIDPQDFKAF